MKNILIDTCSWIDLLSEDTNKLLPHLEFWKDNNCINLVTHQIILDEWNKHKLKQKKRFADSLKTKYEHVREIGKKEKLLIPENLEPNIQNIESQIQTIDELLKNATLLETSDDIKIFCSDRTITKKAPFHNKLDSTKDAYIIFSALKYFTELKQEFLFISANIKEFGSPENLELEIHPDIIENYPDINVHYISNIGGAINSLKQELSISLLPEEINNSGAIDIEDEILIDKTKPILDQIYDYVTIRHEEIKFYPISIFTNHYPFKLSSYNYYSTFGLTIDNDELFELFKSVEILENNNITITNAKFYEGVENYLSKIKTVLSGLSQNLIFNISCEKSRERISIRFSEEKECECPKSNFEKFKFTDCFNTLASYTNSKEDLQESSYLNYLIGNYLTAAEKQKSAFILYKKKKLNISCFISQFNLSKLAIFIRNNYFGEDSQNALIKEFKGIDLEYEATNLTSKENKKVIKFLKENTFYTNARDKIQELSAKLIDQYYSSLNGGWSSNSEVWILINEFAKLDSFLSDNFIIYDKFNEFHDVFTVFMEGLFASHAIEDSHNSRLGTFDDWLIIMLLNYGNSEIINNYYRRYKLKNLTYQKTSTNGESFSDLIDNFFNNTNLRESFNGNCESGNRRFWEYYNSIFKNILTLVSILDFDKNYIQNFTQKLLNYLEHETFIHPQSFKVINTFLYRCGKEFNKEILHRFFVLGINNRFYHNSDFFEALSDITISRKMRLDITEAQFKLIKNIVFEECSTCMERHQNTLVIPICQLLDNEAYKREISDVINRDLHEKFSFELFYQATLFELIPLDREMLNIAISSSIPQNKQVSFKSVFSGIDDNRFSKVNSLLNLCFKFNIDTTTAEFKPFKSLDKYYEWLVDMDSFDYNEFQPKWIGEYATRYYYKKIYNNKMVKEKVDGIIKGEFDSNLEREYLNIYVRKTWNVKAEE